MADEKTFYKPFNPLPDGGNENEFRYRLQPTSKMHVRAVCDVMAKRMAVPDPRRCEFADQAGYQRIQPDEDDSGGKDEIEPAPEDEGKKDLGVFELHDVWSEYHVHAALAQTIFAGFPKIIEATETDEGWDVEIVDQALFDRLDEEVVNAGFFSYNLKRSGTQNVSSNLLADLPSDLPRPGSAG